MNNVNKTSLMINTVFKAIALAMAVAVVATNILGAIDTQTQFLLIGIGLFAMAISSIDKE